MATCDPQNCPIDQIEFGKLIQAVETLTTEFTIMSKKVDCMSQQISGGKGVAAGLMLAAGGIGAGASQLFRKMFE